jgi:hypothetical protein
LAVLRDVARAGGRRWEREKVIPEFQHQTSNSAGIFNLSTCEVKRLSRFVYKNDLRSFHCIGYGRCATIPPKSAALYSASLLYSHSALANWRFQCPTVVSNSVDCEHE